MILQLHRELYKFTGKTIGGSYKYSDNVIAEEHSDGSKKHNRLWNGGNDIGTVKLYDKVDGKLKLVDEIEATHIGCEYGEYDE